MTMKFQNFVDDFISSSPQIEELGEFVRALLVESTPPITHLLPSRCFDASLRNSNVDFYSNRDEGNEPASFSFLTKTRRHRRPNEPASSIPPTSLRENEPASSLALNEPASSLALTERRRRLCRGNEPASSPPKLPLIWQRRGTSLPLPLLDSSVMCSAVKRRVRAVKR
jgi:hypothetical protein